MSKSKIEWTEVTWNPVLGCSKVSEGCRNCYAMTMSSRIANAAAVKDTLTDVEKAYQKVVPKDENGKYLPKWNNKIALVESRLEEPLRWQKPRVVFVNSMSDLFHPDVPFEFIDKVFDVMARADKHIFQILTKRPERMEEYLSLYKKDFHPQFDFEMMYREASGPRNGYKYPDGNEDPLCGDFEWPLKNVWLGTSVEDQKAADERIPHLLNCPASVRFLSCEPLLGPVDLWLNGIAPKEWGYGFTPFSNLLHWVIAGGESGHNARPMHPDWVRSLRDQCVDAGVSFFFKQWGKWVPEDCYVTSGGFPEMDDSKTKYFHEHNEIYYPVGKKKAGRLLDGVEWNQTPE